MISNLLLFISPDRTSPGTPGQIILQGHCILKCGTGPRGADKLPGVIKCAKVPLIFYPVPIVFKDDIQGILVIEGEGEFLGKDEAAIPAKTGDILISDIREPHGVRATTNMRIIVTIAPPI